MRFRRDNTSPTAATPAKGALELAKLLNIKADKYGFVLNPPDRPADTSIPGIFACGFCKGPCDIPEAVSQASAAAERAAARIYEEVGV